MASSLESIKETFKHEGGIQIDNDDNGGVTYLGIAYNSNPNWDGWDILFPLIIRIFKNYRISITSYQLQQVGKPNANAIFNAVPKNIKKDINNAIPAKVEKLALLYYKRIYWDTLNLDNTLSQSFAESMFDFGVNTGTGYVSRLVQRIIKTKADGQFGTMSCYTLNCKLLDEHHKLHTQFAALKILKYVKIVKHPKQARKKKYFFGWLKRAINIYFNSYDLTATIKMINSSSKTGLVGPKGLPGYAKFLEDDVHRQNLQVLVETYKHLQEYKTKRNLSELIQKVSAEFK